MALAGAIIARGRYPETFISDIYAQRVDSHGNVLWMKDGVFSICSAPENQNRPRIISDGAGGAIITRHDGEAVLVILDVYAQRIDGDGNVQWAKDGIPCLFRS